MAGFSLRDIGLIYSCKHTMKFQNMSTYLFGKPTRHALSNSFPVATVSPLFMFSLTSMTTLDVVMTSNHN